jgi:hypothetical protein
VFVAPGYAALAAPNAVSPANGASVNGVPIFRWSAVSGADHYQFQIAATNTFSPALYSIDTKNTRATLTHTLQNKTYYWRVRAVGAGSSNGPWSGTFSTVMAWSGQATPTSPATGSSITYPHPLLLNWTSVPGAEKYRLTIASDPALSNPVGGTPITTQASAYALQQRLPDDIYYWGVTPIDAEAHLGTPSQVFHFNYSWPTDTVLTVNDLNSDSGVFDPQFSWDPVPGAAYYKVDVSSDPDFPSGSIVCCTGETVATSMTPTTLLPSSQAYYWRVTPYDAEDQAGTATIWSDGGGNPQTFTITFDTGANAISGLSMRDSSFDPIGWTTAGVDTDTPIVGWNDVPGAAFYEVQVSPFTGGACDWATKTWDSETVATAWTPLGDGHSPIADPVPQSKTNLATDLPAMSGDWCVRVKAHRDDDTSHHSVYGSWSYIGDGVSHPSFNFTGYPGGNPCQSCNTGYLGSADYLLPQVGQSNTDVPVFTWDPIQGADSYYVVVATDATFTNIVDYAFTKVPAYAPRAGLTGVMNYPSGTYYWAVLPATNPDGTGVSADPSLAPTESFVKLANAPTLQPVTISGLGPVLQWSAVQGAIDYHVQISDTSDFSKLSPPDGIDTRVDETSYTTESTLPANKTIYWRVEGEAPGLFGGTIGLGRSVRGQFSTTLGVPSFTTPVNFPNANSGTQIPIWQWNPVSGAAKYNVHLDCDQSASCSDGAFDTTAAVMVSHSGTLPFQWSVAAEFPTVQFGVPGQPVVGDYTALQNYASTIPAPGGLSSTASGANNFSMQWSPVFGMKDYKVEVSTSSATRSDGSFAGTPVETIQTYTTNAAPQIMNLFTTPNGYTNGGTLYWHVAAYDAGDNLGAWSATKSFNLPLRIVVASSTSYLAHGVWTNVTVTAKDSKGHALSGVTIKASGGGITATSKKTGSTGKVTFKLRARTVGGKVTFTGTKSGLQTGTLAISVF